jgi:hypothetical protein
MFDERGHRSMTLAFYLTGKERTGVVGVKVQKVIFFLFRILINWFSNRIFQINLSMIIFLFNLIDHGVVEI